MKKYPTYVFDFTMDIEYLLTLMPTLQAKEACILIGDLVNVALRNTVISDEIYQKNTIYPPGKNFDLGSLDHWLKQYRNYMVNFSIVRDVINDMVNHIIKFVTPDIIYQVEYQDNTLYVKEVGNIYKIRYIECLEQHNIETLLKEEESRLYTDGYDHAVTSYHSELTRSSYGT